MIEEAFGMIATISFLILSALALKVVLDATYLALPKRAQQFLDEHF